MVLNLSWGTVLMRKYKLRNRILAGFLVLSLVLVFVLSLTGCSRKNVSTTASEAVSSPLAGLDDVPTEKVVSVDASDALTTSDLTDTAQEVGAGEASVGSMTYFPFGNGQMAALMGTSVFTLYFKSNDILYGSGSITVYDAGTNQVFEKIDVSDSSRCKISDIDSAGKTLTSWESGKMVKLYFDTAFSAGRSYYILMDDGCFTNGVVGSAAVLDPTAITFSVKAYGIGTGDIQTAYAVQNSVNIPVVIGGDCASAVVKDYDGSFITLSTTSLSTNGNFTVSFLKSGTPSVTIKFLDSNGVELDSVSFVFNVVG